MRTAIICIIFLIIPVMAEGQRLGVGQGSNPTGITRPAFEDSHLQDSSAVGGSVKMLLSLEPNESVPSDSEGDRGSGSSDTEAQSQFPINERTASYKGVTMSSGRFMHGRLVFEERLLERQGQSKPAPGQFLASSWKFVTRSAALPYLFPTKRLWQLQPSVEVP